MAFDEKYTTQEQQNENPKAVRIWFRIREQALRHLSFESHRRQTTLTNCSHSIFRLLLYKQQP
jgi:hypothetical protein